MVSVAGPFSVPEFPTVSQSLVNICCKERFADVYFVVGQAQDRIPAHKIILAARSEVFAAMLFGGMKESVESAVVYVPDLPSEAFQNLLSYIYTDSSTVNTETVLATLYAAKKYGMAGLASQCIQFLRYNLSSDNVCQLLEQALMFDEAELIARCKRVIEDFSQAVLQTDGFASLPESLVVSLLQDSQLRISEVEVFRACVRWADFDIRRQGLTSSPQTRRSSLQNILPFIRFPLMTREQLLRDIAPYGILSDSEFAAIIASQTALGGVTLPMSFSGESRRSDQRCIYVVGGNDGQKDLHYVELYDPSRDRWTDVATMSTVRGCSAASVADGAVYAIGGDDVSGNQLASCEWYDTHSNRWFPVTSMNSPRSGHAAVTLDNHIFAIGGCDSSSDLQTVERYDPRANLWNYVSSMHWKRSGLSASVVSNYIFAVGGYDGSRFLSSMERYDGAANVWAPVSTMHTPRADLAASSIDTSVFVVGGFDGTNFLATGERYDCHTDRWMPIASMNYRRRFVALVNCDNLLYAIGGHDGSLLHSSLERYDPRMDQWMLLPSVRTPRYALAAAVL